MADRQRKTENKRKEIQAEREKKNEQREGQTDRRRVELRESLRVRH